MAADMPESHQKYMTCNEDDFRVWAMSAGPMAERVVTFFLESGKAPEQGYKACANLMKLGERTAKNVWKWRVRLFSHTELRSRFGISTVT